MTARHAWHHHYETAPKNRRSQSVGIGNPTGWVPRRYHRLAGPLSSPRCGLMPSTSRASCWHRRTKGPCGQAIDHWPARICRAEASWKRKLGGSHDKCQPTLRLEQQLQKRDACGAVRGIYGHLCQRQQMMPPILPRESWASVFCTAPQLTIPKRPLHWT